MRGESRGLVTNGVAEFLGLTASHPGGDDYVSNGPLGRRNAGNRFVLKGEDIGVVVVSKILPVYFEHFGASDEHYGDFAAGSPFFCLKSQSHRSFI